MKPKATLTLFLYFSLASAFGRVIIHLNKYVGDLSKTNPPPPKENEYDFGIC
jgi:hypothetical protein